MMDMVEDLSIQFNLGFRQTDFIYDGKEISLQKPFRRAKMFDLFKEYVGRDLRGIGYEDLQKLVQELGIDVAPSSSYMKLLDEVFSEKVQPHLIQPTFIIDYPIEMSPLAKKHQTEEGLVERFELFVNGG